MKVLLVNPRTDDMITTELPGYVSKEVGVFPPLGLLYLAAYARRHGGHQVKILDMPAENLAYSDLAASLRREEPDLVGITGTTHNLVEITRTAECVKSSASGVPVCVGGPHVDAFPREAASMPAVDFAVRGEGERPFLQLLEALENRRDPAGIAGLCTRREGRVLIADPAAAEEDLDELPFPARDLLRASNYYYVLGKRATFTTLLSTRGCPFRCIFCSTPRGTYRMRSPENLADEMESCLESGAEEFHFVDDTFNVRRERLEEVSREIIRRKLKVRWSLRGRVDTLTEEGIRLARAAGCVRLQVGIETGSDAGLRVLRKGITTSQVAQALAWARKWGLTTAAYFLIGCPHEKTRADVLNTVDFACRVNPDFALFNILTIYPHTELFHMAVEKGLVGKNFWLEFVRHPTPDFQMKFWEESFDRQELMELLRLAYRRFYLRPSLIWRNLRSLGSLDELRHKVGAGISLLLGRNSK